MILHEVSCYWTSTTALVTVTSNRLQHPNNAPCLVHVRKGHIAAAYYPSPPQLLTWLSSSLNRKLVATTFCTWAASPLLNASIRSSAAKASLLLVKDSTARASCKITTSLLSRRCPTAGMALPASGQPSRIASHCQCILQAGHRPAMGTVSCSHLACSLTDRGPVGMYVNPSMTEPPQWADPPLSPHKQGHTKKGGCLQWLHGQEDCLKAAWQTGTWSEACASALAAHLVGGLCLHCVASIEQHHDGAKVGLALAGGHVLRFARHCEFEEHAGGLAESLAPDEAPCTGGHNIAMSEGAVLQQGCFDSCISSLHSDQMSLVSSATLKAVPCHSRPQQAVFSRCMMAENHSAMHN